MGRQVEHGERQLKAVSTKYVFRNKSSYIEGTLIVTNYKVREREMR